MFYIKKKKCFSLIIAIMRFCILQIETRDDPFLTLLMDRNQAVCKKYGIEYVKKKESDFDVPPYWYKVFDLHKLMLEKPNVDTFMWMDSDTCFVDFIEKTPFSLIQNNPDFNMWISKDSPRWVGEFNAGAFLIRNNDVGSKIMAVWKSYYNPSFWEKSNNKWVSSGTWAGPTYEQGAFIEHIIPLKEEYKINQMPYYIFNENDCSSPNKDAIVYHFAAEYKIELAKKCSDILSTKELYTHQIKNTYNEHTIIICVMISIIVILLCFVIYK